MTSKRERSGLGAVLILAFASLLLAPVVGIAQDLNLEQQIFKALTKNVVPRTRGLTVTADNRFNSDQKRLLDSVRGKQSRNLTVSERQELDRLTVDKPSIDVEVKFDFGSANIGASSLEVVTALGRALSNAALKDGTIVIAGHTDSVGGVAYNQELSELRADSIRKYLVEHFNLPADNLVTVGYGKSKPKNPRNPAGPENRRVQIVNMETE
jgi:outer membrane protein OmpA-like peptidoglycan-associated protein